jgi:hypothetical protein
LTHSPHALVISSSALQSDPSSEDPKKNQHFEEESLIGEGGSVATIADEDARSAEKSPATDVGAVAFSPHPHFHSPDLISTEPDYEQPWSVSSISRESLEKPSIDVSSHDRSNEPMEGIGNSLGGRASIQNRSSLLCLSTSSSLPAVSLADSFFFPFSS